MPKTLNVLWAGNSEWGRWLGLDDAKGVQIIASAVDKANERGCVIYYTQFDAAKRAVSQQDVGDAMLAADVYLCASDDQEGTPLPVVEAMAAGCAVVTTDVGVAREIFPPSQHELMVARDATSFARALQRCAEDIFWNSNIGKNSRQAMRDWCFDRSPAKGASYALVLHSRSDPLRPQSHPAQATPPRSALWS
jgi:glycosyltransferase involved in cell wall biosynthesis